MSSLLDLFQQAQISEAAYANLLDSTGHVLTNSVDIKSALQDKNNNMTFASAQADSFVEKWRVIDQYTAPDGSFPVAGTGFSATLFQEISTGRYTFAIRGTEPSPIFQDLFGADFGDIVVDGIAMDQLVDMYNYWKSLTTNGTYQAAKLEININETATLKSLNALRLLGGPDLLPASPTNLK